MRPFVELARRLMKLPDGNPPLPAGDPASVVSWNPDSGYLKYRLVGWFLSLPFAFLFAIGLVVGSRLLAGKLAEDGAPTPVVVGVQAVGVVIAVWILLGVIWSFLTVRLELEMLRYTLTDRALRLRRGVRQLEEVTVSFANVQNVRYEQGPLQRAFGIADVVVEVAGGGGMAAAAAHGQAGAAGLAGAHQGRIVGVSRPEELRQRILDRVRRVKGSGLGEDEDEAPHRASDWPAAAGPLLAEIRDELAATRLAWQRAGRSAS